MLVMLVGYMGSGKSSVGPLLARSLGYHFIDLDEHIVQDTGCTIDQLFNGRGERGFRMIEQRAMRELLGTRRAVIATGGGTPCHTDMMEEMLMAGTVVHLQVTLSQVLDRISWEIAHRPMLKDHSGEQLQRHLATHMQERERFYFKAHISVNTDAEPAVISEHIKALLKDHSR